MVDFELRLLRCYLGGARDRSEIPSQQAASGGSTECLENGIMELVSLVERGLYQEALSSRWLSMVVGEAPNFDPVSRKNGNAAEEFYNFVESRIMSFLSLESESGNDGHALEDAQLRHGILVMALGVAALSAFLQANMTGPIQKQYANILENVVLSYCNKHATEFCEKTWDVWARTQLMVDGCDILGKISSPQYLILAKLLLVNPAEVVVNRTNADASDIKNTSNSTGPRTRSWWAFRVLLIQQRILAERSASLRIRLVSTSFEITKRFDTVQDVSLLGWKLQKTEAECIVASAHLEIGLMEHIYGHDDAAREGFKKAANDCGLELALTGVLGFRTQYQTEPKAQMVLVASTSPSVDDETNWLEFLDSSAENSQDKTTDTEQSEILLAPRLADFANEGNSTEDGKLPDGDLKILKSIEQAIILAMCVDVKKSNPDDELRDWQMAPFIEAVDSQPHSHLMVKAWCKLLRIRWEKTRTRTRERSFLMMEQLADDVRQGSLKVSQRMCYVFCVPFPIISGLLNEYADILVGFGLVGDAMKLFEELELWNNLIDCYCLLGKKTAAAALIRERLEVQPNDPRLWCSLGDVIMDDDCYHKAWEVSGHRFTRAQRSLARTAFNKGNYVQSIQHWDLALSLNPLHPDGWFALGSAALKARDLEKALVAFTRQVQLDPENGESWNNIAALKMQKKQSKEAFVAFREALKLKRNSWQIWENFGLVALDVANFGQAVLAIEKVLDLSQEKRVELIALTRLIDELEIRKGLVARSSMVSETSVDGEPECEELEDGLDKDAETWSSLRIEVPSIARKSDGEFDNETLDSMSSLQADFVFNQSNETEMLVQRVGKLLSRIVARGSGGGEIWGLKARWHKLVGETSMQIEALLKQVRAHQGSKWQHSLKDFQIYAKACIHLCEAYMQSQSSKGSRKRELFSAQMLLRNTTKQGEEFSAYEEYKDLMSCLDKLGREIQVL